MKGSLKLNLTTHAVRDVGIRRSPSKQLDRRASQGPDVRFGRGSFELNDLRSHPIGTPCNILYLPLHRAQVQGDTEVRQFNVPVLCGEDVGCFEVAMDNVTLMEVTQTLENLDHVTGYQTFIQLSKRSQGLAQRAVLGVPERFGRLIRRMDDGY